MRASTCIAALALILSPAAGQMKPEEISGKPVAQLQAEVGRLMEQQAALEAALKREDLQPVKATVEKAIQKRKNMIASLTTISALKELLEAKLLDADEQKAVQSKIEELIKQYQGAGQPAAAPSVTPAAATPAAAPAPNPPPLDLGGESERVNVAPLEPAREMAPATAASPAVSSLPTPVPAPSNFAFAPPAPAPAPAAAPARPSPPQTNPGSGAMSNERPPSGGKLVRTIVGFEQAGASASQHRQTYFLNLFVNTPLPFRGAPRLATSIPNYQGVDLDLGPRWRTWADLRVTSVPQQISTSVAEFSNTFAQRVGELKVNEVVQSAEFLAGVEWRWFSGRFPFRSADNSATERYSVSLIVGAGVITPMTPKDSVQIFQVPQNQPEFFDRFPQVVQGSTQFVAFTLPDRDRFFRQAYGGLRFQTHYLDYPGKKSRYRPPAMLDLTYGFNESVTGGRMRGRGVFRVEGFIPLPYTAGNWIYLYGTALFAPAKAKTGTPFLLDAAPAGTLPTDPNAVVITVPQIDRDYYRLGVGMDFIRVVAKIRQNMKDAKAKEDCDNKADAFEKALCRERAQQE